MGIVTANLSNANLSGANLTDADLTAANLAAADLTDTKLTNANFSGTKFWDKESKEAQNITPEQIKQAKNWKKAIYSPQFRRQLGLPPEKEITITV